MIVLPEKIETSKVIISETKDSNSKIFYKNGEELVKFRVQSSKMRIPWDPKERTNQNGKVISINLCVSTFGIYDDKNKKRTKSLLNKLTKIEKSLDVPQGFKLNSVLYQGNPNFDPVINLNVSYSDGHPDVVVFDESNKVISFDSVKKGCVCEFIFKVSHFWKSKDKCGIHLVVEQIKVIKKTENKTFQFVDDDSDSD